MEKHYTKPEKIVKKMVTRLATPTPWEWPPQCIGFMYQPVRPNHSSVTSKEKMRF